jgi:hypothetical protein
VNKDKKQNYSLNVHDNSSVLALQLCWAFSHMYLIYSVLGTGSSPVFRCLVVIILTDILKIKNWVTVATSHLKKRLEPTPDTSCILKIPQALDSVTHNMSVICFDIEERIVKSVLSSFLALLQCSGSSKVVYPSCLIMCC